MSQSSDLIRGILTVFNEQVLSEEPLAPILQDAKCGKELLQFIRQHRVAYHDTDFEKVEFTHFLRDEFDPHQIGIIVGETGCAVIRKRVGPVMAFFIRGFEQKFKLKPEYFSTAQTGQLFHFIGNVKKCYVAKVARPARVELDIRRQNARADNFDEETATQLIFKRIKPVLIPIIKKSFLDVQHYFKNAIDANDYETARMYSTAAEKSKKFLVLIDRADSADELPGFVDGINYRTEFTSSIRRAFTDMHKKYPPFDLIPSPEDSTEDIESRKLYRQFLMNASTHTGIEVKYIMDRFRESCLTG